MSLIALGLCVVLWGTAYKLSLYHSSSKQGSVPAKLCTRFSDVAQDNMRHATTWPAHAPEIRVMAVEAETPMQPPRLAGLPEIPQPVPSPLDLRPHHMLRPPPASFSANV